VGLKSATPNYCGLTPPAASSSLYPIVGVDRSIDGSPWIYVPPGGYIYMVQEFLAKHASDSQSLVDLEVWMVPGQMANTPTAITLVGKNGYFGAAGYLQSSSALWFRPSSISHDTGSIPNGASRINIAVSTGSPTTGNPGGVDGFILSATNQPTIYPSTTQPSNTFLPVGMSGEIKYSVLPWSSTRLVGVSALFTNTTKALDKEGDVLCGRLNPCDIDYFNHTRANLNSNHPSEKLFLGLEDGFYMYAPPGSDIGNFVDYTYYSTNSSLASDVSSTVPTFNLGSTDFVCCSNAADPDGGTNLSVSLNWTFEFKTTSTLWQLGVATTPIEQLHATQVVLAKNVPFSSNFDHMLLLRSLITAALTMYPAYAKDFSKGAKASSLFISNKQKTTPKPTTVPRAALPPARFVKSKKAVSNPLTMYPKTKATKKSKSKLPSKGTRNNRARGK